MAVLTLTVVQLHGPAMGCAVPTMAVLFLKTYKMVLKLSIYFRLVISMFVRSLCTIFLTMELISKCQAVKMQTQLEV